MEAIIRTKYEAISPVLDERTRRLWAAAESRVIGYGGDAIQKGKVERAIRYLRERFLAGRSVHSAQQGNRELWAFLEEVAHAPPHPTQPGRTVAECLAEEKQRLLPLPQTPANTDRVAAVNLAA